MPARKNNESASWEVDADKPKPKGETRARRSFCTKELLQHPAPGVETIHDLMIHAARTYGQRQAFGSRRILETHNVDVTSEPGPQNNHGTRRGSSDTSSSNPRMVEKYTLSSLEWLTYEEALQEVRQIGSGLRELGAGSQGGPGFFGMYAGTSRNWMLVAQACAFNGVPICTVHDTLEPASIVDPLYQAEASAVFTSSDLLENLANSLDRLPKLKLVVYDGVPAVGVVAHFKKLQQAGREVIIMHLDAVRGVGINSPHMPRKVKSDDVYCCMFTSGGTGRPKGVLLTHGNVVAAVAAAALVVDNVIARTELYLAFLPQAHIFEFVVEMLFITTGVKIAYGRIKTLTDAGVINCKGDIMESQPSIMIAVPQVWELLRRSILSKVNNSGGLKKSVFNAAVKAKQAAMNKSIPGVAGLTDGLVFNAVRKQMGGKLTTLINGGGPIAPTTQGFLSAALVRMVQGYGLTEATAFACIMNPDWPSHGRVGGPSPSVEIKLVDRPVLGYFSTDELPSGEIYLRGPSIFKSYFKRPDLDRAAFSEDGWFRTGDIGQWNPDGTLTIVDRIKNHVPLAGGKVVALEKVESIYKGCPFVANGMVVAAPGHRHPAMLMVAHPEALPLFCKKHGLPTAPIEELCHNPKVVDACMKEMNATAKKAGFAPHEMLEALVIVDDEWTPESGLVTAAQKLRRDVIVEKYRDDILRVYSIPDPLDQHEQRQFNAGFGLTRQLSGGTAASFAIDPLGIGSSASSTASDYLVTSPQSSPRMGRDPMLPSHPPISTHSSAYTHSTQDSISIKDFASQQRAPNQPSRYSTMDQMKAAALSLPALPSLPNLPNLEHYLAIQLPETEGGIDCNPRGARKVRRQQSKDTDDGKVQFSPSTPPPPYSDPRRRKSSAAGVVLPPEATGAVPTSPVTSTASTMSSDMPRRPSASSVTNTTPLLPRKNPTRSQSQPRLRPDPMGVPISRSQPNSPHVASPPTVPRTMELVDGQTDRFQPLSVGKAAGRRGQFI